ncbi:MAG: hypothetical protein ACTHLE_12445 [Agriterribacter sp.]
MRERNLERLFSRFLVERKGYSEASLLYEASIHPKTDENNFRRYLADLLILDTEFNNYLALIEFKGATEKRLINSAYEQVKAYLTALNRSDLPAFLVIPLGENDFEIFLFSTDGWNKIEKEDFPQYQTLQSKAQADSKVLFEDLNEKKYKEAKRKKELVRATAWSTLLSLIAGMIAVVIFSIDLFKNKIEEDGKTTTTCCDSTTILVNRLSRKIDTLELQFKTIKSNDTLFIRNSQNAKLKELETRLANFEASVTSSPDRLLKLQEINFEFKELTNSIAKEKEISEIKISNLKEKLDQVIIWTSGLIITIIGSIIGFAINAFRKN